MHTSPSSSPTYLPSTAALNAPVNSFRFFCVHARSLVDFFGKEPNSTDATADDFTIGFTSSIDPKAEPICTLRKKMNKQIFHLTKDRVLVSTDKFDPGTDGRTILQQLETEITRFKMHLKSEFQHFKCKTEPILFLDALQRFSTTSALIASMTITNFGPPPRT